MKKFLKTALITLAFSLMFSVKASNATILGGDFIKEEVSKDVKSQIEKKLKTSQVIVEIKQLPYKEIEVPDGNVIVEAKGNFEYFSKSKVVKVDVYVNGYNVKSFGVPVELSVIDYVWVTKEPIRKGRALNLSNLELKKRDISSSVDSALRKGFQFSKYLTKKNYRSGEILDKRYVETIPDVIKNNIVSVQFKNEYINLTIDAEAMENGKIGDFIRVRSHKYKRYYTGKIISPNQIVVKI